jgi:ABC-type molybdate transport system substrate-binding protein
VATLSSLGKSLSDTDIEDRGLYLSDQAINQITGKGTAKVGITASVESGQVDYALDYLHPLLDTDDSTAFTQIGMRIADERTIGNLGLA